MSSKQIFSFTCVRFEFVFKLISIGEFMIKIDSFIVDSRKISFATELRAPLLNMKPKKICHLCVCLPG